MRLLPLLPLLVVAACSDAPEGKKAAPKAAAAEALQPGQWELASEVTRLTRRDAGAARIDTPAGTRETESVCLGQGDPKKPDPVVFVGAKNTCTYDNFYMSGGRLSAGVTCTREGISDGNVLITLDGDYKADSFEITRDLATRLAGEGDVSILSKVTGRRVGACTPA